MPVCVLCIFVIIRSRRRRIAGDIWNIAPFILPSCNSPAQQCQLDIIILYCSYWINSKQSWPNKPNKLTCDQTKLSPKTYFQWLNKIILFPEKKVDLTSSTVTHLWFLPARGRQRNTWTVTNWLERQWAGWSSLSHPLSLLWSDYNFDTCCGVLSVCTKHTMLDMKYLKYLHCRVGAITPPSPVTTPATTAQQFQLRT